MKQKSLLIAGAAVLVLSMTSIVLAGPFGGGMMGNGGMGRGMAGCGGMGMGAGFQGQAPIQLTADQQADWKAWQEKHFQLRKEYIGNLVKSGALTQEQADARISAMESVHAFRNKNGFAAPGAMSGAALTDEQKADMKNLFEQRMNIRRDTLDSYVKSGQITQAQANAQIQRMQERFNDRLENGFVGQSGGRGMGRGGMGGGMGCGPRF